MINSKGNVDIDKTYVLQLEKEKGKYYSLSMSRTNFYGLVVFLMGGFAYWTRPTEPMNFTFTLPLSEPLHLFGDKEDMYDYPDVACSSVFVKRYIMPTVDNDLEKVFVDKVRFVFAKDFFIDIGIEDILTILSYAEQTLPLSIITDRINNEEVPWFDDEFLYNNRISLKTDNDVHISFAQISGCSKYTNYLVHVSSTLVVGYYAKEWGEFSIPVMSGMYLTPLLTKATFSSAVPEDAIKEACEAIAKYLNGLPE